MPRIPKLSEETLELLGLTAKDMQVYMALLKLGTAPLRRIAEESSFNRGTVYDVLKRLLDLGLVSHMDAKTHRYFTAEDPHKLRGLAMRREVAIQEAQLKLADVVPQLQELLGKSAHRPSVWYYEGEQGVHDILEDVLKVTGGAESKVFRVYSSEGIRDLIANAWPGFVNHRIRKHIRVKAIAIGKGGRVHGLDERKWLSESDSAPTYIFIYPGKTAFVSLDDHRQLFGVIVDDEAISATQVMIFDALWKMM